MNPSTRETTRTEGRALHASLRVGSRAWAQGRASARRAMVAACAVLLSSFIASPAAALPAETWVTAFIRFVEWQIPVTDATLVVCQPPDTPELDLAGKQVRGVTLLVMRVARPQDVRRCNLLVAWPHPNKPMIDAMPWIAAISDRPILAIGLGERFCEIGGAVCITTDEASGRENYRLNLDVLARAGFRINAQLLRKQFPRTNGGVKSE